MTADISPSTRIDMLYLSELIGAAVMYWGFLLATSAQSVPEAITA